MTETTQLAIGRPAPLATTADRVPGGTTALRAIVARPTLTIAVVWLALVIVAALVPGALTHHDPLAAEPAAKLTAPDAAHWFGTDQLGRDLYARVVHGTALTLQAAVLAIVIGLVGGSLIGLVAGFVGGVVDAVLMRVTDVLLAIPSLLLSLTIVTVLGFGTVNVAVAVGVASIATIARIMRSEVVRVRTAAYVEAASANGNSWWRVLLVHVLPNAAGPVLVLAALEFGTAILAVSSLSFLGYGAQPPQPEWGSLVATGRDFIASSWWLTTIPGLVIAVTVLAGNRVARALDTERRAVR
ncbi:MULTISPECIES: ABC transporter permease [Curtobacterium]|jgi:peptide/nickel transport system permease protein|uniref:ABC transporter permease n=1 Tax=Curtobacterium TaxID=2034 RepID=UPI000A042D67|nr:MULTISPECIES: ABC transporter permease [Curtobacterium]MBB1197727.1 ABC transporter permease [Curtobacterium flaccumfaciens]WIE69984.1 ABC transporter permease [Curtobacterium sp. MCLR17_054]